MGLFNWSAPLFDRFADRWSPDSIDEIVGWLAPFMNGDSSESLRLLDVGGGTGALGRRIHEATGANVTVLDPTPEMIGYLPEESPVTSVIGSAEDMPFDTDSFDALIITDAFHHFRDQPAAIAEARRVIRTGGGVVVVELDPTGWFMRLICAGEKLLGEPGAFFTPEEMCSFMTTNGLDGECTRMTGATYRFIGTVTKAD